MRSDISQKTSGFYILEFVSVLMIFLPVFLGIIDLYHLFRTRSAVWEVSHKMTELYRRVGANPNTPGVPLSRYDGTLANGFNEFAAVLPYVIHNCPNPTDRYCLSFEVTRTANDVTISVRYQLPVMVIGYLLGNNRSNVIPLSASSTRRLEESFIATQGPWVTNNM